VVHLDDPDLVVLADAPEGPDEVPRLDRPPGPGGEHQFYCWPGGAHVSAVGGLTFGLKLERLADDAEQREVSPSGAGLDRAKVQFSSAILLREFARL